MKETYTRWVWSMRENIEDEISSRYNYNALLDNSRLTGVYAIQKLNAGKELPETYTKALFNYDTIMARIWPMRHFRALNVKIGI